MCLYIGASLAGILGDTGVDPEGLVGARSGVHQGGVYRRELGLSPEKKKSLEMACFDEL